jgi:hypothetical protein
MGQDWLGKVFFGVNQGLVTAGAREHRNDNKNQLPRR